MRSAIFRYAWRRTPCGPRSKDDFACIIPRSSDIGPLLLPLMHPIIAVTPVARPHHRTAQRPELAGVPLGALKSCMRSIECSPYNLNLRSSTPKRLGRPCCCTLREHKALSSQAIGRIASKDRRQRMKERTNGAQCEFSEKKQSEATPSIAPRP